MQNHILKSTVASFDAKQVQALQNGEQKQSLVKRALIVYEGTHQGMYGAVTLSKEFLQLMVDRYNREFQNPKNQNDYAPILKDHVRNVDGVLGRLIPPLTLEAWTNPRTGQSCMAIFGDLRIDDVVAQQHALSGKYSHVSISFDDDPNNMGEIFEISFVAVEAARGSQALNKGEKNMDLQAKLDASLATGNALKQKLKARSLMVRESVKSLGLNVDAVLTENAAIKEQVATQLKSLKASVVKSQIRECVKLGKITKAEFDKIDFAAISAMPTDAQKIVLSAYESRPASPDVVQHGNASAQPLPAETNKKLSSADVRKLMKEQREGKKLSADNDDLAGAAAADGSDKAGDDDKKEPSMSIDDIEEALKKLDGLASLSDKIKESMERMKETLGKLQGEADKDKEEE